MLMRSNYPSLITDLNAEKTKCVVFSTSTSDNDYAITFTESYKYLEMQLGSTLYSKI